jgi:hypothetical protein
MNIQVNTKFIEDRSIDSLRNHGNYLSFDKNLPADL